MMIVSVGTVWGGLAASVSYLVAHPADKVGDENSEPVN